MNHKDKAQKPNTAPQKPSGETPKPTKKHITPSTKKPTESPAKPSTSVKATAKKVETKTQSQKTESKGNGGKLIGILALLIALAVAAACYLLWQQFATLNTQLNETQNIAQSASNTVTDAASASNDTQAIITQIQNQIETLENKLSQSADTEQALQTLRKQQEMLQHEQQTIKSSVDSLQTTANNNSNPSGWSISEALYLVNIANHRLNLEGDIDTAIAALKAADLRLKQTGDPSLLDARRILSNEINALNSVELPDLNGIALSLDSLKKNAESLIIPDIEPSDTFKPGINIENQPSADWKTAANSIWNEVKSLVSVRRADDSSSPPSLAPDQRFYLRQNLRFKLEAARIALLRKDTTAFRQNLSIARDWIQNYFVNDNAAAKNILDSLDQMQSIELKPALPDISASHKMLRALNKNQQTTTIHKSNGESV